MQHKNLELAGQKQACVAKPSKGKARVTTGERAPTVVQAMVVCLGANANRDQRIGRRAESRAATSKQVRAGAADHVLDDVGNGRRQDEGNSDTEDGDVVLMDVGAKSGVEKQNERERDEEGIDKVHR